ncbi:hypothetical protein MNAB215_5183 [Mycobacterium numidiamassiliense]|uniref:Uncharacterized protein n=2 Tax=Mycobacterium numidiamassiliense TaxID=1841861 RepID=A0A2U3PGS1_9MYCO|nr:hypothetical protein MNAB215_5183 [Mycobacterium numidiamassiliense]
MRSGDRPRTADSVGQPRRPGSVMSSEHATERVPLSEIREGDMLQNPKSGNWIKITNTYSTEDGAVAKAHRVYYGDGGEEIDSRHVTGLVTRQVRE